MDREYVIRSVVPDVPGVSPGVTYYLHTSGTSWTLAEDHAILFYSEDEAREYLSHHATALPELVQDATTPEVTMAWSS